MEIPKLPSNFSGSDMQGAFDTTMQYEPQLMSRNSLFGLVTEQRDFTQFGSGRYGCCRGMWQQTKDMALVVIQGIWDLLNTVTTVIGLPSPPQPGPMPPQPGPMPPQPGPMPPPPGPAQPASLIPPWAQMFKYTGNSEWRPGGASQNAYLDLRRELKGKIQSIEILSPDGTKVIATGRLEKVGSDGRPRFRFDISGLKLPEGAIIKATLVPNAEGGHGGIRYIEIPKPGQKFNF